MQPKLTEREWELVEAILAANVTRAELCAAFTLSRGAIDGHLNRIYTKTGARNMPELILMATGLVWCPIALPTGKSEVTSAT